MTKITVSDGQRVELLQAQNLRLSGMVHDMRKELAVSDALLISEAEASLARLARAGAAEAERDKYKKALEGIAKCTQVSPSGEDRPSYEAQIALDALGPTTHAIEAAISELDKANGT